MFPGSTRPIADVADCDLPPPNRALPYASPGHVGHHQSGLRSRSGIGAVTRCLPGMHGYSGLLTPATGFGDVLVERLRKAGVIMWVDR
jgi:hypothetical protein